MVCWAGPGEAGVRPTHSSCQKRTFAQMVAEASGKRGGGSVAPSPPCSQALMQAQLGVPGTQLGDTAASVTLANSTGLAGAGLFGKQPNH
jgi:hypothetical protein